MKYCSKCGKELFDEAVLCPGCGCPVPPVQPTYAPPMTPQADLVPKLSEKTKTNGMIWLVIGILQLLAGFALMSMEESSMFLLVIGVLNICNSISDLNYSKSVLQKPVGIVRRHEALAGPIITLIYNLVVGGLIGVIGSIYYLVAIRNFVMENKQAFLVIEQHNGGTL